MSKEKGVQAPFFYCCEKSGKILSIMNFRKNQLIHWIAALAIAMSSLAPAVTQAISLAKHGQGFAMEICAADGAKSEIRIQSSEQTDLAESVQPCPYCISHTAITPAFNTNLTFQAPQTFSLLPQLFYQSPQPLAAWVTPPSAAPPVQA